MKVKKVYLSGPMTGKPDYNREAFARATAALRQQGFEVTNPHELPDPEGLTGREHEDWRRYLARDLVELLLGGYDYIAWLPGSFGSRGASLEIACAAAAGLAAADADYLIQMAKGASK